MTQQPTPTEPTPETPAEPATETNDEEPDDSFLDGLIESITEIPHWLLRPIFGKRDK